MKTYETYENITISMGKVLMLMVNILTVIMNLQLECDVSL